MGVRREQRICPATVFAFFPMGSFQSYMKHKQRILLTGNKKSPFGKGIGRRLPALAGRGRQNQSILIEKTTFLGEIAHQKAHRHGNQTYPAQLLRRHLHNLAEPPLHGFG